MARPDLRSLSDRIDSGHAESVLEQLEAAIAAEPGQVACFVLLARSFEALDRPMDAVRAWRSAYVLCPDSPVVKDELRRLSAEIAGHAASETRSSRSALAAAEKSLSDDEPYHELDDLIKELETARIVPDPKVKPVGSDQLEPDVDDVVSETLAKIYANQRFFDEAARVYEKLSVQQPQRRDEFLGKAAEIRQRLQK
jgi:tetratricopeptide (TPR) repeat protein